MSDLRPANPRVEQAVIFSWNESAWARYALAVAAVAAALLATFALRAAMGEPASRITFVFFYVAILVTVRFGKLWPGLLSVLLSTLAGNHFFLRPNNIFALDSTALLQTVLFAFIAFLLVLLTHRSQRAEAALRERERELTDFIENATVGLHWVGADGTILWANRAELEMLGYEAEEYIGHNITEFHADGEVIEDILTRLAGKSELHDYEARLRHKDGSIRYGLISSNVFWDERGKFVHTRCFTRDITDRRRADEETARLAAIVESSDDAIIGKTLGGVITNWNEAAERMYGYAAEEVIGRHISLIVPDERAEELAEILAKLNRGERVIHLETERIRKDGKRLDVSLTISPIRDAAGRSVGASTIARNITEQKRVEGRLTFLAAVGETLSASLDYDTTLERFARLAVESLADYCLIDLVGDDGEVRRVATAHRDPALDALTDELCRFPPDLSKNEGVSKVLRAGKTEVVAHLTGERLAAFTHNEEHRRLLERLDLKSFMTVPLVARGRVTGALTLSTTGKERAYAPSDITFAEELARRAALAIENARLYSRAQETGRAKDEFLATLSHELRTPLTPIIGWTHMIRSGRLGAQESGQGLDVIEKNAQSLSRLINDLLDMSSILSGKMRIESAPLALDAVVREAIETVRPRADARSVALEVISANGGERVRVNGDRTRLVQVFWNLLDNAVKFSPDGGRVSVRLEGEGGEARVSVEDEGEGVAQEFLPHVFERFRQADMGTTRKHGGLGIGLALVKSFVEAHGGRVEVESEGEGGACFTVSLPAVTVTGERAAGSVSAGATTEPCPEGACRVLLIEDATDTLDMLRVVFETHGYNATTCENAEEALRVAEAGRFDIIISDIGLPRIDGYELIARLRRLPHMRGVPALALTGYASTKDAQDALDAGFDAHMAKPIDPSALAEQIEQLMRHKPQGDTQQSRERNT